MDCRFHILKVPAIKLELAHSYNRTGTGLLLDVEQRCAIRYHKIHDSGARCVGSSLRVCCQANGVSLGHGKVGNSGAHRCLPPIRNGKRGGEGFLIRKHDVPARPTTEPLAHRDFAEFVTQPAITPQRLTIVDRRTIIEGLRGQLLSTEITEICRLE
jgi:hypothetical protein